MFIPSSGIGLISDQGKKPKTGIKGKCEASSYQSDLTLYCPIISPLPAGFEVSLPG
jgi:hypothetical protein